MINLYSRDDAGALRYHGAWVNDGEIVEHWGRVGDRGETRHHAVSAGADGQIALNIILADARSNGFAELDEHERQYLDIVLQRELFAPSAYYESYSSRTNAIGRHADGQFLALIHGTHRNQVNMIAVALFLFDHFGTLVRADIRSDVPLSDAGAVREQLIQGLTDVVYGDVAIQMFSVEVDGVTWRLADETEEYGEPRVSLYPLDILFYHPWGRNL